MTDKNSEHDIAKYIDDIKIIKSMLMKVDETPMIENWAFFTWGVLMILGSFLHWVGWKFWNIDHDFLFIALWIPIFAVASVGETIAWIRRLSKNSMPLFNKSSINIFVSFGFFTIMMIFITHTIIKLNGIQYIPSLFLFFFAMGMIFYGMISYSHLYVAAVVLGTSAIVINLFNINFGYKCILATVVTGVVFILAGFANIHMDAMKRDQ